MSHKIYPPLEKSIYIVGPHSTGKTTLGEGLLKYYGPTTLILRETARNILKSKGYTAADIESPRCFQMQQDILLSQFNAEEDMFAQYGESVNFISDRAAIDPIIYAMKYSPAFDDWKELCKMKQWEVLRSRYSDKKTSLVVLMMPCEAFLVNDGTRKMPKSFQEWKDFGEMFSTFLQSQGIQFQIIGESCTDLRKRVLQVAQWAGTGGFRDVNGNHAFCIS